jgi:uroporphyrinogen III methyltransferase/synthase
VGRAKPGTVYLVGAGPGDPDLLTLRGAELLGTADTVLHDELVHPALLRRARPDARLEYVGKRGSDPRDKQTSQARIDARLVELAESGLSVVRLKGGDPYLFGRGSEEAETLAAAGVPFEVVPGVTSPLAVGAYAGISLTHRDLASSVVFLSGTTREGEAFDLRELLHVRGTIVVLMAHRRLEQVARALVEDAKRDPSTPALVVSEGTLPTQRSVEGTLADIAAKVRDAGLGTPATLFVGDVVRLRERLRSFDAQPLFGKRVLCARAEHQAGPMAALLRRAGAEPVEVPLLEIAPSPEPERVREVVRALSPYDAVAFTSENAVERFFAALGEAGRDARALGPARVAAVGEGTARALERHGVRADVVPTSFRGEALAQAMLADLSATRGGAAGARVLVPRAKVAREVLPDALRAAGAQVDVLPVYETRALGPERCLALRRRFEAGELDVVLATSGSTIDALVEALGGLETAAPLIARVPIFASLGPVTTAAATKLGLRVDVTAAVSTIEGLIDALEAHVRSDPSA